jgi:hypothetical protein
MQQSSQQLRQRLSETIIELMDGGTSPNVTYDFLVEECPEVFEGFPEQELISLCDEIQRSELPEQSRLFQELFRIFNRQYFAGRLPDCETRVVFDVGYWAGPLYHDGVLGFYERELRRILIRITDLPAQMICVLLDEMARAASDGDDGRWLDEMRRLRKAGAPVESLLIDWGPSF